MADPILTPLLVEMLRHLSQVTSLEQHDSMLADVAKLNGGPTDLEEKKRQFRRMVAEGVKKGWPEEEAVKMMAQHVYGRMIANIPTDGQTRHG